MKKNILFGLGLVAILSGCVSQDEHDSLQESYDTLESENVMLQQEVSTLSETNEELQKAKALYDQNKAIIDDTEKREELTKEIALKEQEVSILTEQLNELKGNLKKEEAQIEKEKAEGVVLQDDNKVKVSYVSQKNELLTFSIENKSDIAFDIFPRYLIINGTSYSDLYVHETIAPNATGTFEVEVANYSEKDSLNSLGGMLELINVDSFNVFHKIEFSDVNIRI